MAAKVDATAPFIGAWTLISYELTLPSGLVERPLGDDPAGRIFYLDTGHMSAQVMARRIDPLDHEDPLQATADEAERAWRNYVGYWGTFTVDAEAGIVVHDVEGAWFPNWIGQKQVRYYGFADDTMTLEAKSPAWHARLIWRRIGRRL